MQIYEKKCGLCKRTIQGTSESQVDFNMATHVRQKHKKSKLKDNLVGE